MASGAVTRITRMEMKGFKSFAKETEVVFGEKFNCILGPNGSGKSNILDALVFVLGKSGAKGLRAEKTANLIYNGGKSKNPAKEGLVAIYFDNKSSVFGKGFDELKLHRIVKPNGQSNYYINDEKKTRQEVLETLEKARINPDGHNIILQGDIVQLIEMSGIERRQMIEEISGIGVYEEKKEKALRELQRVEDKLNETQIILTEREAYLRELKSERDQALKFKDLQDKLKRNKKTVLSKKMAKHQKDRESLEKKINDNKTEINKLEGRLEELKDKITAQNKEIERVNKEIEKKGEKEQVALHKEVEQLRVDKGIKEARLKTLKTELEKAKERYDRMLENNQELFGKIKYIEEEKELLKKEIEKEGENLESLQKRILEYKSKHSMDDANRLDKQIAEIDEKADKIQEELSKLTQDRQEFLREKDRIDVRIEQADEKISKVLEAEKANKGQLEELKKLQQDFKNATKELQKALGEDANLAGQIQTARNKVSTLTEQLTKLQAQNQAIKEGSAAGLAISKVLEQKKNIRGIIGTVAELGSVKQEHQLALEIAAGGRINAVVTETDKVAKEAIDFLRQSQYGVASFLPMNKLRAPNDDPSLKALAKKPGVMGLAKDLMQYDSRYDIVFKFVLGNTLVVKDLNVARDIGIGKARMVTLQGDLAETSGAMQGGFRGKKRAGMGFQQKEVTERIDKLEAELADYEAILSRTEQKRKDNEEAIQRLREHKANLEGDIIKLEKTLHIDSQDVDMNKEEKKRLQDESKKLDVQLDDITMKISKANREMASLKMEKQKARDHISKMRSPEVLAQLNSFEEKEDSIKEHLRELQNKMTVNDSQMKNVLGPETERVKTILKQHEKEQDDFTDEQKQIRQELQELEKVLKEKEVLEQKFLSQFKGLFKERDEAAANIAKYDKETDKVELNVKELEMKNTNAGMELARVKAELAGYEEEAEQYRDVEPFESKSTEDCLVEIKQFERLIQDIGAVNMKALEIYESVESEYNQLVEKKENLGVERQDVLSMINEIDSKKTEIFSKTFEVLNENFQRIFKTLSAKGEAYLDIENPKDIFSAGVMIKVRLTGKKFMDIRSLSGGEKTMTALAFLFAVQEHEPAHFYILDEVDAALDKHNSEKLANLVRAYCKNAQYVVISHNDAVISEADNLYGISMNEHGISKITTLSL